MQRKGKSFGYCGPPYSDVSCFYCHCLTEQVTDLNIFVCSHNMYARIYRPSVSFKFSGLRGM